jgi:hypothetical protein
MIKFLFIFQNRFYYSKSQYHNQNFEFNLSSNSDNKKIQQISNLLKNIFYNILQKQAYEAHEFPERIIAFSQEQKIKQLMTLPAQAEKACRESIIKHIDFSNIENVFSIFKKFKIYKSYLPELQQISIIDNKKYPGFFCTNGDFHKEYFAVYPTYKKIALKAKKLDPQKYLRRLKIIGESQQAGELTGNEDIKHDKESIMKKKEIAENLIDVIDNAEKYKIDTVLLN